MYIISQKKIDLLEKIFNDGHIIDIDFSIWDKQLTMCVLADHIEHDKFGRLPLLQVDLLCPHSFSVDFRHMGLTLEHEWQHFQWRTKGLSSSQDSGCATLLIKGSGSSPDISTSCTGVEIFSLDVDAFSELFPEWDLPYSPLARVGMKKIGNSCVPRIRVGKMD